MKLRTLLSEAFSKLELGVVLESEFPPTGQFSGIHCTTGSRVVREAGVSKSKLVQDLLFVSVSSPFRMSELSLRPQNTSSRFLALRNIRKDV